MKSKEEIKQLAENYWEGCDGCDANDKYFFIKGFEGAYRQCQQNMVEKYTDQDIRKAVRIFFPLSVDDIVKLDKYINSLNKQD